VNCNEENSWLSECQAHAQTGRVVVFDTETTGMSNDDEIVQIAAAEYDGGELTRTLNLYVAPTCEINPHAEEAHGLSRDFLDANGISPADALEQFFDFLGQDAYLVGHNVHFDLRMLRNECRKFNYVADVEAIAHCDTIALAKQLVPGQPSYSLGNLIAALGVEGENSHDALDDTLACGALFFDLVRRIPTPGEYVYERIME